MMGYRDIKSIIRIIYPLWDSGLHCFDLEDGIITNWRAPFLQPTQAQIDAAMPLAKSAIIMSTIRAERDRRLAATDYLAMPDYPAAKKTAGLDAYRMALRDFPATINAAVLPWPLDVATLNWPIL